MAAANYFPSFHDRTEGNKLWPSFGLKPKQTNAATRRDPSTKSFTGGVDQNRSTAPQVEATAASAAWSCLPVSDYRPLDAFSVTAEGSGWTPWSEEDDICQLLIRMKEIELCDMIEERSRTTESKQTIILVTCAAIKLIISRTTI